MARRDRPPRPITTPPVQRLSDKHSQFTIDLNFFIGNPLTVLDAGFALNTQGSLVNGFTPFRAGVAGFDFNFKFNAPPILKDPFFFSSLAANVNKHSTAPFTSLAFKPADSA